ncbi:MAG: UDP-N-acetylglucosamine 2-epimerase (non-hydrolyzing) [Candidatus Scalindua sp.]|nr:UDP-N-acetylglucosamine 2-epimerase (non-hydrolyzing) [Candidatus Scalindua sp.]
MKLLSVAGARPNFMKLASIASAVKKHNNDALHQSARENIEHIIVHTGQHYDKSMSHWFFDELGIPKPDVNLEVGSLSHAQQTAEIMRRFEPIVLKEMPDVLLVVGDVNSTIACTLVASKIHYPAGQRTIRPVIVHVEAGLRSFDRNMPEEINRILTDSLSDLLFVTEEEAVKNLKREGVNEEKIHFAGNVMIDTLKSHLEKAEGSHIKRDLGLNVPYGLVTLHRPSNVDNQELMRQLVDCLVNISNKQKLVFPMHPRTRKNLEEFDLLKRLKSEKIILEGPLGYLDFLSLVKGATLVLTDSGGIQEETTVLGIPCVTLRENTERPVTVTKGSNYLTGTNPVNIIETVDLILSKRGKKSTIPPFWDGKAGERIISSIMDNYRKLSPSDI